MHEKSSRIDPISLAIFSRSQKTVFEKSQKESNARRHGCTCDNTNSQFSFHLTVRHKIDRGTTAPSLS